MILFGYIKIDKYELKYKQIIQYKNLYCSVCNTLKDNLGLKGCLLTSYDAALFLAIFDSVESHQITYKLSCPLNPFKMRTPSIKVSEKAMKYAAFISVYYAYIKLKDNIQDERKKKYKRKLCRLEKDKRFQALYHIDDGLLNMLNCKVDEYYTMEKQAIYNFDELSNKMGEIVGVAFKGYANFSEVLLDSNVLYNIGFNIGKWIYLVDAYDDLEDDLNKKQFNPMIFMIDFKTLSSEELGEKVLFMSKCLTQNIYSESKKLSMLRNREIIDNILIYGMNNSIIKITKKKNEEGKNG